MQFMNTNRRKFLTSGLIGAAGFATAVTAGQSHAQAQATTPVTDAQVLDTPAIANRELTGKVAIVTGARANMGRGFAEALARNGADVVVHYHREETRAEAEQTARLVQAQGRKALLVSGDLSRTANVKRLFDETVKALGQVDIVVNNAGAIVKKPLAEISEEEYDRLFGINSKGAFFVMQEAARRLANNGRIINIGSSLLASTIGNYSAYAGSKAPLEDFSRALAREISITERGITINTVCPGPIDTPFFHGQETPQSVAAITRLAGRLGEINDIVPIVEFLASPQAGWVNAQTLFVNGGYVTR